MLLLALLILPALCAAQSLKILPPGGSLAYDLTQSNEKLIVFTCTAPDQASADTLGWFDKNDRPLTSASGRVVVYTRGMSKILQISRPGDSDGGTYTCKGTVEGQETEASILLELYNTNVDASPGATHTVSPYEHVDVTGSAFSTDTSIANNGQATARRLEPAAQQGRGQNKKRAGGEGGFALLEAGAVETSDTSIASNGQATARRPEPAAQQVRDPEGDLDSQVNRKPVGRDGGFAGREDSAEQTSDMDVDASPEATHTVSPYENVDVTGPAFSTDTSIASNGQAAARRLEPAAQQVRGPNKKPGGGEGGFAVREDGAEQTSGSANVADVPGLPNAGGENARQGNTHDGDEEDGTYDKLCHDRPTPTTHSVPEQVYSHIN